MDFFKDDPKPFFRFSSTLLSAKTATPSAGHLFLQFLQTEGRLLRVYTQNIDGLEEAAGVLPKNIVYAHGNLKTATCLRCKKKYTLQNIVSEMREGSVPRCANEAMVRKRSRVEGNRTGLRRKTRALDDSTDICHGVIKPDITFFGQDIGNILSKTITKDKKLCDCLIVMGTSMQVAPVSGIMAFLSDLNMPRILMNRSDVDGLFDVRLFGDIDAIVDPGAMFDAKGDGRYAFHGCEFEWNGKLHSDVSVETSAAVVGVICDICSKKMSTGAKFYTCTECFNYDICETCRKQETHEHLLRAEIAQ